MTPRTLPKCIECEKTESLLWRNVDDGQICQVCYERREQKAATADVANSGLEFGKSKDEKLKDKENLQDSVEHKFGQASEEKRIRKSTRSTRFRSKASNAATSTQNHGQNGSSVGGGSNSAQSTNTTSKAQNKARNRRSLFKRTPFKTPEAQATTHCVESVFHKGSYLQIGDIVSLVDDTQNVYYAQIRGLLVDNYCEKSAYLTWLIPTQSSPDPKEGFDAATYLIGPDEDLSRKLSCLEFVMHAPSNYYLDRTTPFPLPDGMENETRQGGYVWTTLPEIQRNKSIS